MWGGYELGRRRMFGIRHYSTYHTLLVRVKYGIYVRALAGSQVELLARYEGLGLGRRGRVLSARLTVPDHASIR